MHLPQRGHLPQTTHMLLQLLNCKVNLCFRCVAGDAKAQRAVRQIFLQAQRAQNVRRLERGGCASTAGRERDLLQGHQKALALNERERHVQVAVVALGLVAVERDLGNIVNNAFVQPVVAVLHPFAVVLELLLGYASCLTNADDQRRRQGARAQPTLLLCDRGRIPDRRR